MLALLVVSLIWAASFGLIKHNLAGVDPHAVAWARLAIALPLFLPLLRTRQLPWSLALRFAAIGAVQYGLMYVLYIQAYQHLAAHEVALWTVTTPVYVALCSDLLARRVQPRTWAMAGLAVAGAALLSTDQLPTAGQRPTWLRGVLLIQLANLCFAAGQVGYRQLRRRHKHLVDRQIFAVLLLGAVGLTGVTTLIGGGYQQLWQLGSRQAWTLVYLGAVATGLGFFGWNWGAARVRPATLAVFNNLKVPLAIAVSIVVFGEQVEWLRFACGGLLVLGTAWSVRRG